MTELHDWAEVRARLEPLGRGAPYRLASALSMNSSQLYRTLKRGGQVTARQAQIIADFLAGGGAAPPAEPAPPARRWPLFGQPVDPDGEVFRLEPGSELELREPPPWLAMDAGVIMVRVPGSMMEPRLFAGETIVARVGAPPARDQDVLIAFTDGTATVKTFRARREGRVFVADWHPAREASYPAAQVRALHAVIARL